MLVSASCTLGNDDDYNRLEVEQDFCTYSRAAKLNYVLCSVRNRKFFFSIFLLIESSCSTAMAAKLRKKLEPPIKILNRYQDKNTRSASPSNKFMLFLEKP